MINLFVCLMLMTAVLCGDPGSQNNNENPRYVLAVGSPNIGRQSVRVKMPVGVPASPKDNRIVDKSILVYRTTDMNQFSTKFKKETGVGPHESDISNPNATFAYQSSIDYQIRDGTACQIDCLSTVNNQKGEKVVIFNNTKSALRYYSYGANKDIGCFDPLNKNLNDVEVALNICVNINKHVIAEPFKDYSIHELAKYIVDAQNEVKGRFTEPTLLAVKDQTLGYTPVTDIDAVALRTTYIASVARVQSNENNNKKKNRYLLHRVDRNLQYLPI
ncbi:hypothetical protein AKO1_012104, partial [Acrasis kona]